ncbi:hypothetical protein [uncultured Litoreibacter sp.]|nr:hypothetical protein [uncultured Litoreibacter sp.]
MKVILLATVLAAFSTPSIAQSVISIPQDGDFNDANMRWNGATAKGYDGRIALKNQGGNLAICGVGIVTNIQVSSAIKKSLRNATVKLNGKTVFKDFSYFAKAKSAGALKSTNANCKSTGVPVTQLNDTLSIRYGSATFRN